MQLAFLSLAALLLLCSAASAAAAQLAAQRRHALGHGQGQDISMHQESSNRKEARWRSCAKWSKIVVGQEVGQEETLIEKSGDHEDKEMDQYHATQARCSASLEDSHVVNVATECPSQCPYSQELPSSMCSKVCLVAEDCHVFHPQRTFGDPLTKACVPACGNKIIPGCMLCSEEGVCAECGTGFYLGADGKCTNPMHWPWTLFQIFLAVLLCLLIHYLVCLANRPDENRATLAYGELHRLLCVPLRLQHDERGAHWSTLDFFSNPHKKPISGVGITLFFNWLVFAGLVSLLLWLAVGMVMLRADSLYTERAKLEERDCVAKGITGDHVSASAEEGKLLETRTDYKLYVAECLGTVYVIIMILSIVFNYVQRRIYLLIMELAGDVHDQSPGLHAPFALRIYGLPSHVTDEAVLKEGVERMLKEVLDEGPVECVCQEPQEMGLFSWKSPKIPEMPDKAELQKVIGVSIAYDIRGTDWLGAKLAKWRGQSNEQEQHEDLRDQIQLYVRQLIEETDEEEDVSHELEQLTVWFDRGSDSLSMRQYARRIELETPSRERDAGGVKWWKLPYVDKPLRDWCFPVSEATQFSREDMEETLKKLNCAGMAIAVFNYTHAVAILKKARRQKGKSEMMLKLKFKDQREEEHPVILKSVRSEPQSILWMNFQTQGTDHMKWDIFIGTLKIVFAMFAFLLLYMPYAVEVHTKETMAGVQTLVSDELILGALIGLGNFFVSQVVEGVFEEAAFGWKDIRDRNVLIFAFLSNMINVTLDIIMTVKIARGATLDSAFNGTDVHYNTLVAKYMYGLIVPGYLFTPYIGEVLFSHILPYWIGRWLVISCKEYKRRDAEKILQPQGYDIVWRYADILANFSLSIILMLWTTWETFWVMFLLFVFAVFIYGQSRLTLLKFTTQTFYTSDRLSRLVAKLWVFPTGCLAYVVGWWCDEAGMSKGLGWAGQLRFWVPFAHVCLYALAFSFTHAMSVTEKLRQNCIFNPTTWEEMNHQQNDMGVMWDYFNTNPILMLKQGKPPICPGKAYQFHEHSGLDEAIDGITPVKSALSKHLKMAMSKLGSSGSSGRH
mmetsp:Transcript_151534/g.267424  ORF Transcript_151534/g.267424 Transcript_151534/m.267424 type:complete len:1069 (+) Transcript_151534:83-3289(+)